MSLCVVGAGLGRTGTSSLQIALERLLGGKCYHMREVFKRPEHIPLWRAAANGEAPDWRRMLSDYRAVVDWPAASFWPELSETFPDALVLLSLRDPESWWHSVSETIFRPENYRDRDPDWYAMWTDIVRHRFTDRLDDKRACIDAFTRHNEEVRRRIPPERLLEWYPGDGWQPLCRALRVPVPDQPFPHANSKREFLHTLASRRTADPD